MSPAAAKPKVYRLRNLPNYVDRRTAVELLAQCLGDIETHNIHMPSLAAATGSLRSPHKVATVTFDRRPGILGSQKDECKIAVPGLEQPLILDEHFDGVTPLNDVAREAHHSNCLVISGLASHPFGSWQPRGDDRSFMWIRDEMSRQLPGVRFMLYGYRTPLVNSKSFQTVPDMATGLIQTLKSIGWSSPTAKPAAFMAHSLGGVLLKQTLVMLAACGAQERAILDCIRGAIFFGVPSVGMHVPDVYAMVGGKPNAVLLDDLADKNHYLSGLERQFRGITQLQRLQYFWVYETEVSNMVAVRESPWVWLIFRVLTFAQKLTPGTQYVRNGEEIVMVSPMSATGGLVDSNPALTLQINENHSNMVKFAMGDHRITIIAEKLKEICHSDPVYVTSHMLEGNPDVFLNTSEDPEPRELFHVEWDHEKIVEALRPPERDRRLEQIDRRLSDTFDWAFEDDSLGLTEWLQNGRGIFWIRGKPGSGKSTFMKFLYNDARTRELLYRWRPSSGLLTPSFFFHHRGTNLQKSFEGLLRSIISQILEKNSDLSTLLFPILDEFYGSRLTSTGLGDLRQDIKDLMQTFQISKTSNLDHSLERLIKTHQNWETGLQEEPRSFDSELRAILKREGINPGIYLVPIIVTPPKRLLRPNQASTTQEQLIKYVVQRHDQRYQLMLDVQTAPWTLELLEKALMCLVSQKKKELRICLFLDALDEYNGQPEFIASFLQDLVHVPHDSLSRVRVIFCSRPWNAFLKHFGRCPGLEIHKQTEQDIYNYCAASIPDDTGARVLLDPLIPTVARRARGVFLWVRLVMHELGNVARLQTAETGDSLLVAERLRNTLDYLPTELDDYYATIIDRIPKSSRWDSYVLFESVCRSETHLSPDTLHLILKLSRYDPATALDNISQILEEHEQDCARGDLDRNIRALTGGLVEIDSSWSRPQVQFMHQTVQEFVENPEFRVLLLRNDRARSTHENGHSFLAKHLFLTLSQNRTGQLRLSRCSNYARLAEQSTGCSQFELFSAANTCVGDFSSVAAFSVYSGLELFVNDACNLDNEYVARHAGDMLEALIRACESSYAPETAIEMAEYLTEKGLSADSHLEAFQYILSHNKARWHNSKPPGSNNIEDPSMNLGVWAAFDTRVSINACDQLMQMFLQTLPLSELLCSQKDSDEPREYRFDRGTALFQNFAVHEGGLEVIGALLKRGIDPNLLDNSRQTPLDAVLNNCLNIAEAAVPTAVKYSFDLCQLLVTSGGLLCQTTMTQWEFWMQTFTVHQLDAALFKRLGMPRWCKTRYSVEGSSSIKDKNRLGWVKSVFRRNNK